MPKASHPTPDSPTASLNPVHEFVRGVFPDDAGTWTMTEMVHVAERLYNAPGDLPMTRSKFYDAVERLNKRSAEFEDADTITCIPSKDGYRYPAKSCRLILREVIKGRLPLSHLTPDQNPTKTQ